MDREDAFKARTLISAFTLPHFKQNPFIFFLKFFLLSIFLVFKPSVFDLILKRKEAKFKNLHRGILNTFNTRANVIYVYTFLLTCTPQTGELESIH